MQCCYVEGPFVEYHNAECQYAECLCDECRTNAVLYNIATERTGGTQVLAE
jgi:hypothetical protein